MRTSGYFLIVEVPESLDQPHAVSTSGSSEPRALLYPVRDGAETRYMSEHEVARRHDERLRGRKAADRAMEALVEDGVRHLTLANPPGPWLWFAIRPHRPAHMPFNAQRVDSIEDWWFREQPTGPCGLGWGSARTRVIGPGYVAYMASGADGGVPRPYQKYVQLHFNGSAFAAHRVHFGDLRSEQPDRIGYVSLRIAAMLLADTAAGWATHAAGSTGTAAVASASHRARSRDQGHRGEDGTWSGRPTAETPPRCMVRGHPTQISADTSGPTRSPTSMLAGT